MPLHRLLFLAAPLAVLAACAGGPPPQKSDIRTPEEQAFEERVEKANEDMLWRQQVPRLMLDLQTGLSRYFDLVYASGPPRNDDNREKLERFLRETVERGRPKDDPFPTNFDLLLHLATDDDKPRNRAISVAALGFCDRERHPDVYSTLGDAVQSDDADVSHHAVLGLAVLGDKRTPPSWFARVIRDPSRRAEDRSTAAWALFQLQLQTVDNKLAPITSVWVEILEGEIDEEPDEVVITAIRGLGQTRDAAYRQEVERYAVHPTAMVRMAVAIALGRMRSDASAPVLLNMLETSETNGNVRLAARKALQELAPGIDREYDVEEWRKVFDRR